MGISIFLELGLSEGLSSHVFVDLLRRSIGTKRHSRVPIVWNRSHVLGTDGNHKCEIVNMTDIGLDGAIAPRMCIREYWDVISWQLKKDGFWADCLLLAQLWKSLPDRRSEYQMGNVDFFGR